jgi:hypothetical protein
MVTLTLTKFLMMFFDFLTKKKEKRKNGHGSARKRGKA